MVEAIARAAIFAIMMRGLFVVGIVLLAAGLLALWAKERKLWRKILSAVLIALGLLCAVPPVYLKISSEIRWAMEQKRTREDDGELITAVKEHDAAKVRSLLEAGAEVDRENSYRSTALNVACSDYVFEEEEIAALEEIVWLLVERGADIYHNSGDEADEDGFLYRCLPPLCESIMYAGGNLVPLLLRLGADPNYKSIDGRPLDIAVNINAPCSAKLLLEYGADPLIDGDGSELLFDFLKDFKGRSYTGGNSHARGKSPEMLALLVEAGCNVNATTEYSKYRIYFPSKSTPLHIICAAHPDSIWGARGEAVRLLLEHGADAGAKDGEGKTPLDYARETRDALEGQGFEEENEAEFREIAALLAGRNTQ